MDISIAIPNECVGTPTQSAGASFRRRRSSARARFSNHRRLFVFLMHRVVSMFSWGNRSKLERKQTLGVAYDSPGKLPEGVRIYVVGDIHGRADLLDQLTAKIDAHLTASPGPQTLLEVFLGDYIDRGPQSKQVIERLLKRSRLHTMIFLKGNHENYLCEFLKTPSVLANWSRNGGLETLLSYGLRPSMHPSDTEQANLASAFARLLPETHSQFFAQLKPSFSCGGYFFSHAGVNPAFPLTQQREEDLLWIRDAFLFCESNFGQIVVHGHTPVAQPDIRANRINIDTGAYATGRLTCLVLERGGLTFL